MEKEPLVSMSVVRRLPRYYRFLYDLRENGIDRISSRDLAERMGLTASQIRQDFNCFGGFGQQGYGYNVKQLYEEIGHILGMDQKETVILLGAGNLGKAIAKHMPFEERGLRLCGVFDEDNATIGSQVCGLPVLSTETLAEFCHRHHPKAAILCIPKEAAPRLVTALLALDVHCFWNFSHYDIAHHHPGTVVENVHLGDSLMTLSFRMKHE